MDQIHEYRAKHCNYNSTSNAMRGIASLAVIDFSSSTLLRMSGVTRFSGVP
ncbi:MAG: hypothetical protein ACXWET_07020 [Halobacteriota archaeon]